MPDLIVDDSNIQAVRDYCRTEGSIKTYYRNRGGKQYLSFKTTIPLSQAFFQHILDKFDIRYAFHTSGGGCEHTFRLNPEPRIRQHLDDMRKFR